MRTEVKMYHNGIEFNTDSIPCNYSAFVDFIADFVIDFMDCDFICEPHQSVLSTLSKEHLPFPSTIYVFFNEDNYYHDVYKK